MTRFVHSRFLAGSTVVRTLSFVVAVCICGLTANAEEQVPVKGVFRAGAAAVDITPTQFPVIVNGNFTERQATRAHDRLMSRAVVLDDGRMRLAIVVVDSLMIPRKLLDIAKQTAHESTGIPTERMLFSATHTHSAPSAMECLGSRADADYQQFLTGQIAKSIQQAMENLAAAKVGWTVVQDYEHNNCRRWIYRPDRIATDPFGEPNVRAHMHPGHQSQNHIAPSGPADTGLSLLAVQSAEGRPLVVLANYAMHYYGTSAVSADFCGRFGDRLAELIGVAAGDPPFVGIMSQGTSGDSMWMDYSEPAPKRDLDQEVYGITGLKLKAQSPLQPTFNIELANGAQGYIPPPEQHTLGGYTTWPARTAGLEVQAEPKIVAMLLDLLEKVADKPRRSPVVPANEYDIAVLGSRPVAYWRMNEMSGPRATDAIGKHHGVYENGVAFYLPGFDVSSTMSHRAAHFAGGRMQAAVKDLGETYSSLPSRGSKFLFRKLQGLHDTTLLCGSSSPPLLEGITWSNCHESLTSTEASRS